MNESTKIDPVLLVSVLNFLRRHEHGADLGEMARHFGVSAVRMRGIIDFLWTVEFPGTALLGPESMFDFDAEGLEDEEPWVRLTHDPTARVSRRFDPQELATVLIGLDALREHRSAEERAVIDRLSAKLRGGEDADAPAEGSGSPLVDALRRAIDRGAQLRIRYFASGADAPEWRVVDPLRLEVRGAMVYLNAYCTKRRGFRWFRHDRILEHEALDSPIGEYSEADRNRPLEVSGHRLATVRLAVAPSAYPAVRPYLPPGRAFPEPEDDGFSRCPVDFRSYQVLAQLCAEHAGSVVVEGPEEARAAVRSWARSAIDAARPVPGSRA